MSRGRARQDHANALLMESIVLVALLVVAFAVMSAQPTKRAQDTSSADLAQTARDFLLHLAHSPDPKGEHSSQLDRILSDTLQGDVALIDNRVARAFPPGTEYNLFLLNGQELLELSYDRSPTRQAVSASQLWGPSWRTILAYPEVDLLPTKASALRVEAVPLHNALGLTRSAGLLAEVEFELPDAKRVTRTTFAPLLNSTSAGPAAAVSLLDGGASPTGVVRPATANNTYYVGVEETQGRALPANTRLEVRVPPGFTDVLGLASSNPAWNNVVVSGNASYGWRITADLASPLNNARVQYKFNATQPAWGAMHQVVARLDNGTQGQVLGLVVNTTRSTNEPGVAPGRGPWLRIPAATPWEVAAPAGLVVAYPDSTVRTIQVTRVTLTAVGGASLLAGAGSSPATGWTLAGDTLEWTGSISLARDEASEFAFTFRAHAPFEPGNGAPRGLGADLQNGFTTRSPWSLAHGVVGLSTPAGNATAKGFIQTAGTHTAKVNVTHEGSLLKGTVAYETAAINVLEASAADLVRGVAESWMSVDTREAPLGGTVTTRWDLRRVVEELGVEGAQFKCYTNVDGSFSMVADRAACDGSGGLSWQFVQQSPTISLRLHRPAPGSPGEAVANEKTGLDKEGTKDMEVPGSTLLGTHAVELKARFALLGPSGEQRDLHVRLLGAFDVHRPGGSPLRGPAYEVVLQAWLPDWG